MNLTTVSLNTNNTPSMSECIKNCKTCFSSKIALLNHKTGKVIKPHCKTYDCPDHGWKKANDLAKGIEKWLRTFTQVRMMTFTAKKTKGMSNEDFNERFTKSWHLFVTTLRRNKLFRDNERNVQYIKVYEFHKSGTLHAHVLMSEYIHWSKLQAVWQNSLWTYFGGEGKLGNVNARGTRTPKKASLYVAKYVTKMAIENMGKIRAWSKSGKVAIFAKKNSNGEWMMILRSSDIYLQASLGLPILVLRGICSTEKSIKRPKIPPHPKLFAEIFDQIHSIYRFYDVSHDIE